MGYMDGEVVIRTDVAPPHPPCPPSPETMVVHHDEAAPLSSWVRIGVLNFVSYLVLVFNFRVVAMGMYWPSILSDAAVAWLSYTLISLIAETKSNSDRVAYVVGGSLASGAGIWLTRALFGH